MNEPTHCYNHTFDLVLTYGIEVEHLIVFPHNPSLSDHYLITFEFLLLDYTPLGKHVLTRCLSDGVVTKFKQIIPSVLNSIPCLNTTEMTYSDFSPPQIDCVVDSAADSLRTTLNSIAPLKKKVIKQQRTAPWYNSQTRQLKQT